MLQASVVASMAAVALADSMPGPLLAWYFEDGSLSEAVHGDAANAMHFGGDVSKAVTADGKLELQGRAALAATSLVVLPGCTRELKSRSFEAYVSLDDYSLSQALFSLDSIYYKSANGAEKYTHNFFDGVLYNEAGTKRFEFATEHGTREGSHAGDAEEGTSATARTDLRHIVLTQDAEAKETRLYVDGVLYESVSSDVGTLTSGHFKVLLGWRHSGCNTADCRLSGKFEFARLFDVALSAAQVTVLFHRAGAASGKPQNLVHDEAGVTWVRLVECDGDGPMQLNWDFPTGPLDKVVSVLFEPSFAGDQATLDSYTVQTQRCNYAVRALNARYEMSYQLGADGAVVGQADASQWYGSDAAKARLSNICNTGTAHPASDRLYHGCGSGDTMHFYNFQDRCLWSLNEGGAKGFDMWVALDDDGVTCDV